MTALHDTLVDDSENWSTYQFCFVLFMFDQTLVKHLNCHKGLFCELCR